jgi:hypothetical protein
VVIYDRAAVQRAVSILIVPVLLAASALAFLRAEQLKLAKPPIRIPLHGFLFATFSPVCGARCPTRAAILHVRLVSPGSLAVDIVDASGHLVRHLVPEHHARGTQTLRWDGRDDAGAIAPDGTYHLRLTLRGRRYTMPNPIVLDTHPPAVVVHVTNATFSPDGDGLADRVILRYRSTEQLYGGFRVRGRHVLRTGPTFSAADSGGRLVWSRVQLHRARAGVAYWNGSTNAGPPAPPGRYRLALAGHDLAGNAVTVPAGTATLRYVTVVPPASPVQAGSTLHVRVDADHPTLDWRLLASCPGAVAARGRGRPPLLTIPLPASLRNGRYQLEVRVPSHKGVPTRVPLTIHGGRVAAPACGMGP